MSSFELAFFGTTDCIDKFQEVFFFSFSGNIVNRILTRGQDIKIFLGMIDIQRKMTKEVAKI